jgi:hypothetical protein
MYRTNLTGPNLHLTTNKVFSGANSATQSWFWANSLGMSGTLTPATSGLISPFSISVSSDSVDASAAADGMIGFSVRMATSANHVNKRIGMQTWQIASGLPLNSENTSYAGSITLCSATINLGGTTGAATNYKGNIFAGNSNAYLGSSVTFLRLINAHEFDTTVPTGASVASKFGISIVKGSDDAVRGTFQDAAIAIADQDGAGTWSMGLQFGMYSSEWAFGTDSTLIGVMPRVIPSSETQTANYGVDWTGITFTAGGAGFVAPLITPASASATGKAGSIVWDANFIYVCTATNTWKRVAIATW